MSKKIIGNVFFVILILVVLFVPPVKAFMIQGLMGLGLFKPNVDAEILPSTPDLSQIKFKNAKGKVVNLNELKGKVVFINFWATWCPPCLAEMPSINKLHQQLKNDTDVVFLMIDADSDFPKAQAYMDKRNYQMPVYTFASDLPKELFKGSLPTTIVFDKKGRISFNEVGAANYSNPKFIAFIKQLKELKN
ncbi:TlpA family protein disulfide reductase [Pedobacter frigiditerrae]|nr:TlpA disulfide reductase family protein [Pedobacter frigiditerrae]